MIISENDMKRGVLNFNVSSIADPSTGVVSINENIGTFRVPVTRTGGSSGKVGFKYDIVPQGTSEADFSPSDGTLMFNEGETYKTLDITINDDNDPEVSESFYVEMKEPVGGAQLGSVKKVDVKILANDQPNGVFG